MQKQKKIWLFNVTGSWVGKGTPAYLFKFDPKDIADE